MHIMYVSIVALRCSLYVEYLLFVACGNIVSYKIVFDDCSDVTILYRFKGTRIKSIFLFLIENSIFYVKITVSPKRNVSKTHFLLLYKAYIIVKKLIISSHCGQKIVPLNKVVVFRRVIKTVL